MAIIRDAGALVGTNEETLQEVAAGATHEGAEVDVLGSNSTDGTLHLYVVTQGSAKGSVDVQLNQRRVSGQAYKDPSTVLNVPVSTTKQLFKRGYYEVDRYAQVTVTNNDASNPVQVAVLYSVVKYS